MPFFYHSFKFFTGCMDSIGKTTSGRQQSSKDTLKSPVTMPLQDVKEDGAFEKGAHEPDKISQQEIPRIVQPSAGQNKPKEQKYASKTQEEILYYRLNSKKHIKRIQEALVKAGFYKGEIDGKMGPRTKLAIKNFQKARKINADGIIGPKTWEALEKYLRN